MLLTLVIIVALIWAAVIGNIYSGFITFYSNFSEIENYNKAYYASIAALERAELVTKQRQPWYNWSGWWINNGSFWSYHNWGSDWVISSDFSYLSRDSWKDSTVFWEIESATSRIPREWFGDIDKSLVSGDAMNYNMMDYNTSETFMLFYDSGSNNQYTKVEKNNMTKSTPHTVSGKIRLPLYLYPTFWNLSITSGLILNSQPDDIIVDWQVIWKINNNQQFTIFYNSDTENTIRESKINDNGLDFEFWWNRNPIWNDVMWNVISPLDFSSINNFKTIFENNNAFEEIQIRLSLLNLLKNWDGMIYPYLEYYIQVGDGAVIPDKYFNIDAEWIYWDYRVNLIIHKPTNKESNLQSFTTILN